MSKQDKKREKRRLARLQKAQQDRAQAQAEETEDEDEEEEPIEKSSYYSEPVISSPMPTSWKELDDLRTMREREEKIREAGYDVQDLVSNILYSSALGFNEKADAIRKVGEEFGARVQNAISQDVSQMSKDFDDLDLLYVKALIATDARHTSGFERFTDWIEKKKLTAAAEAKLSDEDFALPEKRKYPVQDKAHVRNALARAAQMIDEGGDAAEDAKKALPRIRAAAKKMGIGMSEKSKSALLVEKAGDGNWRMVGMPTNKWIDWHGDILSEKAHVEYVDWVNKNMDAAPLFMTWHTPGTERKARVDFVGYENGFLIVSAPLTNEEAAGLLKAQEICDIGMSHTTLALERDPDNKKVITKYRIVEVTDLPLDAAANPFTSLDLVDKEAEMAIDTKAYLAKILGSDEKAESFLKKVGLKEKQLTEAGVPAKEKEEKPADPPAQVEAKPAETVDIEAVVERVSKEFGMEELSAQFAVLQEAAQKVEVLEKMVQELSKNREEELAEMIAPKAAKTFAWLQKRDSQSDKTVLQKDNETDKKLAESKPNVGWLSEITKTAPIN